VLGHFYIGRGGGGGTNGRRLGGQVGNLPHLERRAEIVLTSGLYFGGLYFGDSPLWYEVRNPEIANKYGEYSFLRGEIGKGGEWLRELFIADALVPNKAESHLSTSDHCGLSPKFENGPLLGGQVGNLPHLVRVRWPRGRSRRSGGVFLECYPSHRRSRLLPVALARTKMGQMSNRSSNRPGVRVLGSFRNSWFSDRRIGRRIGFRVVRCLCFGRLLGSLRIRGRSGRGRRL
jgi:hypothetical protein